ncbi:uncharacterized protein LOC122641775 isoform X2 [Telopea speciosissima]|uniref:uncharacterized protein LOC122641775 isoform X2 n=1 Tax=Telopea speciosissima TaxID=54955 RepID=UPI001CC4CA2B|nr:uncharacterized protein LOC122641775 isoform X2 [Telopea speciosissima]
MFSGSLFCTRSSILCSFFFCSVVIMADFPPNLDDGELWLPSDIFPEEVSPKISPKFPSEISYMEDLARQLASYALLERNQNTTKPPPNLVPESKQQSRYGTTVSPRYGFGFDGVHGVGHRQNHYAPVNGGFRVGLTQVYRYHPMSPAQAQVENLQARVLQRLQNRNRFLPVQVNETRIGGFVRESGGTGVFLPRVSTTLDVKKKQHCVKKGEEFKQKQPIKKAFVEKHERFQSSPEVRLPQDWTY